MENLFSFLADEELRKAGVAVALLRALRQQRLAHCARPHWSAVVEHLQQLNPGAGACGFGDVVELSAARELSKSERERLRELIRLLMPWRKGPFRICGEFIDAEWRSDMKWQRIAPHLPSLKNKRVIDVGCSNGYYLFRMLAQNPALVLGVDPDERSFLSFQLLQKFAQQPKLSCELLGVSELEAFAGCFDVALCMGVFYHRKDPVECLRQVRALLVPGGTAVIEGLGLKDARAELLQVRGRYAKMRNVYAIPSVQTLLSWMEEAGFRNSRLISSAAVTSVEQRRTELMPFESLEDFLDPSDPSRTIEGYPAPWRIAVLGEVD